MRQLGTWLDRLLIPLLLGLMLIVSLGKHRTAGPASVIWSDAEGYYLYLPATFIYGKWDVWNGQEGLEMLSCCAVSDSGIVKTRYTYGVAAMQLPFFLGAHAYASIFQGPGTAPPADYLHPPADSGNPGMFHRKYNPKLGQATGFSDVYGRAIMVATAFYVALGLWFLRGVLRRYFAPGIATAATALTFLATNLYYYSVVESSMSHAYSFALFAALLWLVQRWLAKPNWALSLGLGLSFALILLIRPTNIVVVLLLLLWEVYRWSELKDRIVGLLKQWHFLAAMAGIAVLVIAPQLFYWKYAFGNWVVWSYEGEGFSNALHPQILKVLFSYQNGLFLYTPIALLAVLGIGLSIYQRRLNGPAIGLLFLLGTYTFASWWAWWFGGAFGHRCYVEFYALMALPLALVLEWGFKRPEKWLRWLFIFVLCAFVYANLKMTSMYNPPWDGPDWTWQRYLDLLKGVFKFWWWPGF